MRGAYRVPGGQAGRMGIPGSGNSKCEGARKCGKAAGLGTVCPSCVLGGGPDSPYWILLLLSRGSVRTLLIRVLFLKLFVYHFYSFCYFCIPSGPEIGLRWNFQALSTLVLS